MERIDSLFSLAEEQAHSWLWYLLTNGDMRALLAPLVVSIVGLIVSGARMKRAEWHARALEIERDSAARISTIAAVKDKSRAAK